MSLRICQVFNDATECPERRTHTRCFACGLPACRACSVVVARYRKWKHKRICENCQEDNKNAIEYYETQRSGSRI
jgi:hypothetical protein